MRPAGLQPGPRAACRSVIRSSAVNRARLPNRARDGSTGRSGGAGELESGGELFGARYLGFQKKRVGHAFGQLDFDVDLWIVEIEDRLGRHFLDLADAS